ncbi:MAG: hypothetical protein OXU36_07860 [Candidatus Poribacteria bacterium]|nr:hypothetical protein [Candidatus Poribacteria bacterium]
MFKFLATFIVLLVSLCISGCGADDTEVVEEDVPVSFVSARPPSGDVIGPNSSVTITFDGVPIDITANRGNVEVIHNRVIVSRLYTDSLGEVKLIITWADGTHTLLYVLTAPCADENDPCG